MKFFSEHDREGLTAAEEREPRTPLPVRMVASEEYLPITQAAKQRESEQPMYTIADEIAPELGMSRRRFFQTSAGMAAGFLVLNQAVGPLFSVGAAEAADARANFTFDSNARPERLELPTTWFEVSAINLNCLFIKDVVWALVAPIAPQCSTMHSSITQNSRKSNPPGAVVSCA